MWSWSHDYIYSILIYFYPTQEVGIFLTFFSAKVCPASFSNPKASKKQPLCAKIFKKISEDTPTSTSVLQVSCKMFSPTWIVEVSSRTKSVEHVITVQPSLHAMLLRSFELNHQPKYFSSHKNGKRKQTKLTFPYNLLSFFCLAFPFPFQTDHPLKITFTDRW